MKRASRNLKLKMEKAFDEVLNEMNEDLYNWVTDRMLEMDEATLEEDLKNYLNNIHKSEGSRD